MSLPTRSESVYSALKPEHLPEHVAIIMDGNGRWAGQRSLKRFVGHQQGAKSVQLVTETASRIGLPWLTLYAFSLENNLRRPRAEINFLMRLLKSYLESNVQRMMNNNVRIRYIGRTRELPLEVQDKMNWAEEVTARNTGTTLTLALNYGGRSELVDAFPRLGGGNGTQAISASTASLSRTFIAISTQHTCPTPICSFAPRARCAFRISSPGRLLTPRSTLPNASGPISAAFTFSKQSPTSSAANAGMAALAHAAVKSKKTPTGFKLRRVERAAASSCAGILMEGQENPTKKHDETPEELAHRVTGRLCGC